MKGDLFAASSTRVEGGKDRTIDNNKQLAHCHGRNKKQNEEESNRLSDREMSENRK